MGKNELVIEENIAVLLRDIYDELSDLNNVIYFLSRTSNDEDSEGIIDVEDYKRGRTLILETMGTKLENIMHHVKQIMQATRGDES